MAMPEKPSESAERVHLQWNGGWETWQEVMPQHAGEPGVVTFIRATTHQRTLEAERDAWVAELRPLIEAGAFEGVTLTTCERCGAPLTDDEVASVIADVKGCWRMTTGRDSDPCPGKERPRITYALARIKEAT